jgi:hypothetical protein
MHVVHHGFLTKRVHITSMSREGTYLMHGFFSFTSTHVTQLTDDCIDI